MKIKMTILSFLAAAAAVSAGCSGAVNEIARPYSVIEEPSVTPSDLLDRPATVFAFSEDRCDCVRSENCLGNISSLSGIAEGDKVVSVVYSDASAVNFSNLRKGSAPEAYELNLYPSDGFPTPEIWYSVSTAQAKGALISQLHRPLTSRISLQIVNSHPDITGAYLTAPSEADTWKISGGALSMLEKPVSKSVKAGESLTVMPQEDKATGWTPSLTVETDGGNIFPALPEFDRVGEGQDISFTLDFSGYASGKYTVSWEIAAIAGGKVLDSGSREESVPAGLKNGFYRVSMLTGNGWETLSVHKTLCSDAKNHRNIWNDWSNSKALRDTMSYCVYRSDFSAPVKFRVKNLRSSFSSVSVRPSTYGIETTKVDANTIEFTIPSYGKHKVSVEFDGDRQHNLFLYGVKPDPDKPTASSANVKYYGPGEHTVGQIKLSAGETLYVDYGAKLYITESIVASGAGVTIAGGGIISGEKMTHYGEGSDNWGGVLLRSGGTDNLKIKDVSFIDGPGWNLMIYRSNNVTIDNVNTISWELNGDGIDLVSCTGVEIRDCFLRNYDDCITLKCRLYVVNPITDMSDVTISRCLIWNDYARGIVIGPEAGNVNHSGRVHDITVNDCIFLQHKSSGTDDLRAAFAIGQGTDGCTDLWNGSPAPTRMSGITANNLVFDSIDNTGRNISIWQYGGSTKVNLDNVTFNGIKVITANGSAYPAFNIKTNGSTVTNLVIKNFTVNGQAVTGTGSNFSIDTPANVGYEFR